MTKYIKQIEELSNLVTDANRFLAQPEPPKQDSIREQIKKLELNIAGLTQRLEALEQRTQPSDVGADARNYPHEKGVWVTISTLRNVVRTTDLVQGDIGLKALIKRLGLEE